MYAIDTNINILQYYLSILLMFPMVNNGIKFRVTEFVRALNTYTHCIIKGVQDGFVVLF